jgi:hypothetical protein
METIKSPEHALALLKRAVDERGADHVANLYDEESGDVIERGSEEAGELNTGCRYFTPTGEPDCIAGTALSYLGATPGQLPEGTGIGMVVRDGQFTDPLQLDRDQVEHIARILEIAQMAQDGGKTWGEALVSAQQEYKHTQRQPVG